MHIDMCFRVSFHQNVTQQGNQLSGHLTCGELKGAVLEDSWLEAGLMF